MRKDEKELKLFSTAGSDQNATAAEGEALQKRKILFYEGFNSRSVKDLTAKLMYLDRKNHKDIYLYINSPGGYVTDFLAIYDIIQNLHSRVVTIAVGQAASAGAFLLMSGTPKCRAALKHARIMFHQPSGGFFGTAEESKTQVAELDRLKEILISLMMKHSTKKLSRKKVLSILNKDTYLDADQAKKLGLIDIVHGA